MIEKMIKWKDIKKMWHEDCDALDRFLMLSGLMIILGFIGFIIYVLVVGGITI